MITKEEREKDKAICDAATPGPRIVIGGEEPRIDADGHTIAAVVCWDLAIENARALANAADRLPLYIDALDKIDERMATIEELTRGDDTPESKTVAMVLRILRGGQ